MLVELLCSQGPPLRHRLALRISVEAGTCCWSDRYVWTLYVWHAGTPRKMRIQNFCGGLRRPQKFPSDGGGPAKSRGPVVPCASSARIRRRSRGSLNFTCCWPSDLLQRKLCHVLHSLQFRLGLTFSSHCILLCFPNSAPVLKVLVPILLSCIGSLICNNKSVWLGMLTAA